VTVERTRTTTYYENGDVTRHTELVVTSSANGKTIVSRNAFNVFIDADSPNRWMITGTFEKAQLHGRTIWLQSDRLVHDLAETGKGRPAAAAPSSGVQTTAFVSARRILKLQGLP
jgi:2-hydroxychromene-2-carboxylate isomerase